MKTRWGCLPVPGVSSRVERWSVRCVTLQFLESLGAGRVRAVYGNLADVLAAARLPVPVLYAVFPWSGMVDFRVFQSGGGNVRALGIPTSYSPYCLSRADACPCAMACLEIVPDGVIREALFWLGERAG